MPRVLGGASTAIEGAGRRPKQRGAPDQVGIGERPLLLIMLDAENWKIVLKVYAGHPIPALLLAQQLTAIRQSLEQGPKGIPDAIAGLNLAIDGLFDHTDFNKVSRKLYRQRLDGTLRPKQEEKLQELGVKI